MNQESQGKRKFGPFELGHQLGVGGMGVVYAATYVETGQPMALKILSPILTADKKLLARFEREIDILKRLRHPNIIRYFGGGKEGEQRYYAMEVMDGGTFDAILKKRGRLSWEQAIEMGRQLCSALEYAHNNGIIHRDLKPANLFLTKKGKVKLGDFGIARDTEATALTAAGKTVGTYAYMAPEQIVGKPAVSRKTDLYAMGCVLFQMMTGRTPFEGESAAEMMFHHIEDDPPTVREFAHDCPIWLEQLVERLLEKDPDDRPYDALAVLSELDDIKEKMRKKAGVIEQSVTGNSTTSISGKDRTELLKVLGKKKKKKKKKKKDVPLLERWPVLLAGLALVCAAFWYGLKPKTEQQRRIEIITAMETQDPDVWREVRPDLDAWLEDYPEHEEASEMREYIEMIEMEKAERQALTRVKFGRKPKSEAERLFVEAYELEQFGDRVSAAEKYRSIISMLEANDEENAFVSLARRRIKDIQAGSSDSLDRVKVVNKVLRDAEALFKQGKLPEARGKWESILTLYGKNREFARQVKYAQARLANKQVPEFDFGEDESDDSAKEKQQEKAAAKTS